MAINAATALLVQGLRAATQAANVGPRGESAAGVFTNILTNVKVAKALLPSSDTWWVLNVDTGDYVFGQYTTEVQSNASSTYADSFSLGRNDPVTQFVHGNLDTMSFEGRFFASFAFQEVVKQGQKLQEWTKADPELGRPPVCYFWIGDQFAQMTSCRIQAANIKYDKPTVLGQARGARVAVSLRKYEPFSLTATANFDTLYYRSKPGDSYEKLAARRYGNPMLGVELRNRNPDKRRLTPGDIVAMPAPSGSIRRAKVEPRSVVLAGVTSRLVTPQRVLLTEKLKSRNAKANAALKYSV